MHRSGLHLPGFPFFRLLLPLSIGICIQQFGILSNPFLLLALFPAVFAILLIFKKGSFYFQPYWGALLMLFLICFGYVRSARQIAIFPELAKQQYFAVLDDYPLEKGKSYQVVGRLINSELKILTYLPKLNAVSNAKPGDILCFTGLPEIIKNEGNPYEFNYRNYLNKKNIGYRIFLKESSFHLLNGSGKLNISHRALILRNRLIEKLHSSGIANDHVHLISSISFGARDEVDKETIQSFTNTGVIHVLAVSGMNVGLIFVILDFLFRFLKTGFPGKILHTIIILLGIWSYALITGMSASILRAAMMFSFLIIGKALQRNSNIFNTLAISAFLLIAWDPYLAGDVGFQLSYAAVLSIVVLQPLFYKLLFFKNIVFDKFWMMLTVTFAAQIGTLPFTLYYFHQFPVYFWLANLAVIPLVSVILYLTFVVVFLSFVSGFLTSIFAFILDWSVRLVLISVNFTEQLPHAVLKDLYPSVIQVTLMLVIVVLLYVFLRSGKIHILQGVLLLTIMLSLSTAIDSYRRLTRAEIVFFNIPGTRAMVFTTGRNSTVLYDHCLQPSEKLGYYMKPYFGERWIRKVGMYRLSDSLMLQGKDIYVNRNFIFFKGVRLYVQSGDAAESKPIAQEIFPDVVWLGDFRAGKSVSFTVRQAKVILYHSAIRDEQNIQVLAHQQHFNLFKAVHLEIKDGQSSGNQYFHCSYFDKSDRQAIFSLK